MRRKQTINLLVVVLAVGFVLSFLNSVRRIRAKLGGASIVKVALPVQDLTFLTQVRVAEAMRKTQYAAWLAGWGRDPFIRGAAGGWTGPGAVGGLVLSGIVWDETLPIAIINSKVMKVGDEISGIKITRISPNSVFVKTGEETVEIPIFKKNEGNPYGETTG